MKYHIITYGCQMNHSDSERIASVLEEINYQPASNFNEADLILINACSVRQSAIDRIHGKIKDFAKLKMENTKCKIILTGCLLKEDRKKFQNKVDLIFDIKDLPNWPQKLTEIEATPKISDRLFYESNYLKIVPKYQTNFSAYVPIMTGCDNFCTFCAVPYTRGREISREPKEILCEVENLIKRSYKEIWLLGQNVNSYKSRDINFPKLLKMANNIPGNFWVRFTSSHPKDFSEELIDTMTKCQKITEYLNLPVQSGDDEVLRKMNRPYTIGQYKETVKKIRGRIPNIALSTDVIVGFPGETEKQFQNTILLFEEIKFDMAYIAKFSPRPGTPAAKMEDDVPNSEKERRWKILSEILKESALENNKQYLGKIVEVLVDEQKNGFLIGKTRAFKTVKFKDPENLIGNFVKIKVVDALPWGLKGEMI